MKQLITLVLTFLLLSSIAQATPPERNTDRDCITKTITDQIGVREATGHNDGQQVEIYLASVKTAKGAPWCAAYVNWSLQQCKHNRANSAWSPSWFPKSKIIYDQGAEKQRPIAGDVFGLYYPTKKRIAHVGFIYQWTDKNRVTTIEGNTNEAGSREGDGVYKKYRLKSQIYQVANWIG
jgi:hypothetical protein